MFGLGKEESWSCCSNLGLSLNGFFFLLCFRLIYEDVPVFPTMERFFLANTWRCCCQICYRSSDRLSFSNRLRGLFQCSVFLHAFTVNRCICNCRCNAAVVVCTINDVWDPYTVLPLRSNWTEFITNSFDFFFPEISPGRTHLSVFLVSSSFNLSTDSIRQSARFQWRWGNCCSPPWSWRRINRTITQQNTAENIG